MDNLQHETDHVQDPLNVHGYANNSNDVSVIDDDVTTQEDADENGAAFRNEQEFPHIRDKDFTSVSPTTEEADHPFQYSSDTSDLRLIVEGKPLYVSRVVLSLISPVLKRLFGTTNVEDTIEFELPGKKYDDMVEFLCCVYPDILNPITEDNITAVLPLADEYQVKRLLDKCEDFLVEDIKSTCPKPRPNKIVNYLGFSEKYGFERLQKASYETAAKTESDLLENVQDFWDLPSVTTTSVFIRRLKLLEQCGKSIRAKIKELQNHCGLYHKGDRDGESVCTKCYATIGKTAQTEIKNI